MPPSPKDPLRFELRDPPSCRSCIYYLCSSQSQALSSVEGDGMTRGLRLPSVAGLVWHFGVWWWIEWSGFGLPAALSTPLLPSPTLSSGGHRGKGFHEKVPYKEAWHGVPVKSWESVLPGSHPCLCPVQAQPGSRLCKASENQQGQAGIWGADSVLHILSLHSALTSSSVSRHYARIVI